MADVIEFRRHWQRRGDAADWTSVNPVLASGEFGYEEDTGRLKIGDGSTAWNSLAYQIYEAPIDGNQYVRQDGDWVLNTGGGGGGSGQLDASTTVYRCWDFLDTGFATSSNVASNFVTSGATPVVYTAGASSGVSLTSDAGAPGILTLTTGTATTGRALMYMTPPVIRLGSGELIYRARLRIPTLSNGTDRFAVSVTMTNVIDGAPQRIAATYTDNINSGQWFAVADGAGSTTTNTTVAPAANTWTKLELRVNAAGTSFDLFIDGVNAGTVGSNLPTVSLGICVRISKSAGTTARTVDVDFGELVQTLSTAR